MFGYLRFFLASMVVLSHVGIGIQGVHPGVASVVVFYMLAGFVVCNLFTRKFMSPVPQFRTFYIERLLRIFPQYLFIAGLTLLFLAVTGYGNPTFRPLALLNNLLIVPLNYYMWVDSTVTQDWWLITPAWSLGAELQSYLILPVLLVVPRMKRLVAYVSLGIFSAANFGHINSDWFGYRLLPGVMFVFILGGCIYRNATESGDSFDKRFPVVVYAVALGSLLLLGAWGILLRPYVRETLMGLLLGLPVVTYIARSKVDIPANHLIGDLSYGVFLAHFPAIWVIDAGALIDRYTYPVGYVISVFAISISVALAGVLLVERGVKAYRYRMTGSRFEVLRPNPQPPVRPR